MALGKTTLVLDDDFIIDWPGFRLFGEGEASKIVQKAPGCGFLQIRADGAQVGGFDFTGDYQRHKLSGSHRGYLAFHRVSAVWVEGSNSLIHDLSAHNSFVGVCLRGPVDWQRGRAGFDYTRRAVGNVVRNVAGSNCDFVLTGNQQENLLIDGLDSSDTTNLSVPPHAIYMQNPASAQATCGFSKNVILRNLWARGNAHGEAFKLSDIRDLVIENAKADRCAGGLMISTTDGAKARDCSFTNLSGRSHAGVSVSQSNRVEISECSVESVEGSSCTGFRIYHHSQSVTVTRGRVIDHLPAGSSDAPYRVADGSYAFFDSCSRRRLGFDRPMFVVSDGSAAQLRRPRSELSSLLLQAAKDTQVRLALDKRLVDRFEPGRSIAARGGLEFGPPRVHTARAILPGADGNAACLR